MWLRFLGRNKVDILEKDIVQSLDEMDEISMGRAICYLGDIKSRLCYDKIILFLTEEPSHLRPRVLYYLYRVEPEQLYTKLRELKQVISGKILVSDDNSDLGAAYRRTLEREGLGCIDEWSPLATLKKLESDNSIVLLITDIMKPEMSGMEMITIYRATLRKKYIPIIVASATGWSYALDRMLKVDLVIPKPFSISEFIANINLLLLYNPNELEQHLRTSNPTESIFKYLY